MERRLVTCALLVVVTAACGGPQTPPQEHTVAESTATAASAADAADAAKAAGAASAANASTATNAAAGAGVATSAAPATPKQISDADRAAILQAAHLQANPQGQVKNECDDMVTPELRSLDLGPAVGTAVLLAMGGGPSSASCYGDGPGLTVFRRDGASWKEIYSSRGGFLAVMREQHNGAPDIVFAGPGLSHPAYEWNGTSYARTTRTVADERLADAKTLP